MEQDILINTKSGDVLIGDVQKNVVRYDVVWGSLFNDDDSDILYANIIVPFKSVRGIEYSSDGVFECDVVASYMPEEKEFVARFVTIVENEYQYVSSYTNSSPEPSQVFYKKGCRSSIAMASQLPMFNIDGYFHFVFKNLDGYYAAFVYSGDDSDFEFGPSDDQAAQLLSICAPGKYYKHPTTGVDVTKYINSVVSHTDLPDNLFDQFQRDDKGIYEADFDSNTGILNVGFNGSGSDLVDENMQEPIDVENLDIEAYRVATDEYIQSVMMAMNVIGIQELAITLAGYEKAILMKNLGGQKGTLINTEATEGKYLDFDNQLDSDVELAVVSRELSAGTFIRFELDDTSIYDGFPIFNLVVDGNVVYESVESEIPSKGDCALILQDCTLNYTISILDLSDGFGIYVIDDDELLKDMVVVASDDKGKMMAILTNDSNISDVVLDGNGSIIAFKNIE